MSATGPQVATERANGWTRQLRVTPLSERVWLASKIVHGLLLVTPGVLALVLVGVLYGQVRLGAGQWAALIAVLKLGALPFVLLGLVIGLQLSVRAAQVVYGVAFFGMAFVSGVLVPWPQLPNVVQAIGVLLPPYHLAGLGWEIVGTDPMPICDDPDTHALAESRSRRRLGAGLTTVAMSAVFMGQPFGAARCLATGPFAVGGYPGRRGDAGGVACPPRHPRPRCWPAPGVVRGAEAAGFVVLATVVLCCWAAFHAAGTVQ